MFINRHNYEEFFLLYVDNELNQADRAAVEQFIEQNPDVAEEMNMLREAVLPGEKLVFEQKELLYNQQGISLSNYEEYFLLSVDEELSANEKEEVEKFVLQHPEVQSEYTLTLQTRIEPEAIVFKRKEELYRNAGKERRVIWIGRMKMSAAAAVIGLVAITWFFTQKSPHSSANIPVVGNVEVTKPLLKQATPMERLVSTEKTVASVQEKVAIKPKLLAGAKEVKNKAPEKANDVLAVTPTKKLVNRPAIHIDPIRKAVEAKQQEQQNTVDNATAVAKTTNKNNLPSIADNPLNTSFANKMHGDDGLSPLAKHAVYKEIDNQEEDDENSFYLGSAEINKTKLKGLLKKATHLFGKKSNKSDGEKTLKIAGFEIKSK